jgi:hypothetical protein
MLLPLAFIPILVGGSVVAVVAVIAYLVGSSGPPPPPPPVIVNVPPPPPVIVNVPPPAHPPSSSGSGLGTVIMAIAALSGLLALIQQILSMF